MTHQTDTFDGAQGIINNCANRPMVVRENCFSGALLGVNEP